MDSPSRVVGEPLQTMRWTDGSRVLLKPLVVEALGYRIRIEADDNFKTDFSSIPSSAVASFDGPRLMLQESSTTGSIRQLVMALFRMKHTKGP